MKNQGLTDAECVQDCAQKGVSDPFLIAHPMPVAFGLIARKNVLVWQSHIPVPAELRHLYGGKRELRESLHTRDRSEAERRARDLCLTTYARFDQQWRELHPERVESLTPAQQAALVAAIRHDILNRDDLARFNLDGGPGLSAAWKSWGFSEQQEAGGPTLAEALAEVHAAIAAGLRDALANGDAATARALADGEARKHLGLSVEWARPENQALAVRCLRAAVQAWGDRAARDAGEAVETPEKPQAPEKPRAAPKLRDALAPWKAADPTRNAKYVQSVELALKHYESVTGDPPLSRLTVAQGDDLRSWLLEVFDSPTTAAKKLDAVRGLLNYAVDSRGLVERNPWTKLKRIIAKGQKRTPWTADELGKLFGSPIFTGYRLPTVEAAGGDGAYWVPLMSLYSGARVSELCQLRLTDVFSADSEDGPASVPVLRIVAAKADEAEGTRETRSKTEGSERLVPIHAELIRLGLLEYVEALRIAGAVQLFPMMKRYAADSGEGAGSALSTWFGEYRKAVGVDRPMAGLHAARATVRTALDGKASDAAIFAIGGWTAPGVRSVGTANYFDARVNVLRDALNLVGFPGLRLDKVFKAPAWTPGTAPVVHKPRRPVAPRTGT